VNWQIGVRHPVGIALLSASIMVAVALTTLPPLAARANRAPLVLAAGLVAFAITATVVALPPRTPITRAMRQGRAVRRAVAARLAARQAVESGPASTHTRVLTQALDELDRKLLPALAEVTRRHVTLGTHLAGYERGEIPLPGETALIRLKSLHQRQSAAIESFVREAANADAALLAFEQETDDAAAVDTSRRWSRHLESMHDALTDVLQSDEEQFMQRLRGGRA
jgi:hypothetical protein